MPSSVMPKENIPDDSPLSSRVSTFPRFSSTGSLAATDLGNWRVNSTGPPWNLKVSRSPNPGVAADGPAAGDFAGGTSEGPPDGGCSMPGLNGDGTSGLKSNGILPPGPAENGGTRLGSPNGDFPGCGSIIMRISAQ